MDASHPASSTQTVPAQNSTTSTTTHQGLSSHDENTDLRVRLSELHTNQSVVLESLSEINWRFSDASDTFNLDAEAERAKKYLEKLRNIRQNMTVIHNKLTRMQERAFKIQQFQEKEYTNAYRSWVTDLEYQRHLMAKFEPSAKRSNDVPNKTQ